MKDIDPLAIEVTDEINAELTVETTNPDITKSSFTWEHEDLAKFNHRRSASNFPQVRIRVIRGHTDAVKSCHFCDNDRKILTGSYDKTSVLWDVTSGSVLKVYEGHTNYITQARASPDCKSFVSSSWDKTIKCWDVETGDVMWTGTHGGIVTCCNFSHDGKYVIAGSDLDFIVRIYDAKTGDIIHEIKDLHTNTVTSCMFSGAEGNRIITTAMDQTKFWDCTTMKTTLTLKGHDNVISAASLTPDERKLSTVSWDKSIQIWDISTGMYRSQGPWNIQKAHEGSISSCSFSPDGSLLVTGGYDQTVALWDVENMVQRLRLQGHTDWVEDVGYSKDMKWLLSSSRDKTVRLWNIEESDNLPMVLENRKSLGLKIFKCQMCQKPFSLSQMENPRDGNSSLCVFCRLETPERNIPSIE